MAGVKTHLFRDDGTRDHRGKGRCAECLLPEINRVHSPPPETPPDDRSAAILGEGQDK